MGEGSASLRLALEGIDKSFPGVQALRGASLSLRPGEVHALLGENGAGKSTLMKILTGQIAPDRGTMALDGAPYAPRSPLEAQARGIAMIHQELSIIGSLTVGENLLLGAEPARAGLIDRRAGERRARALLEAVGSDLDPRTPAGRLSVAQRQLVEIAKALRQQARVLVMDEPTAALHDSETERLFALIRNLAGQGVAVVYISHRLPEIFALAERLTILRDGSTVATWPVAGATAEALIAAMVGRPVSERIRRRPVPAGPPRLTVRELTASGARLGPVSFAVHAGEIFGLGGLMGSGRTELARAIFGADARTGGEVQVGSRRLRAGVREAIDAGIGLVTEDRKAEGLVLDASAAANMTLAVLPRMARAGVLDLPREVALAEGYRDKLRIRLASIEQRARTLSGGNQQKLVIARWLLRAAEVLILDEPTRGVDVGAKAEIHQLIVELAESGVAILLISSELPELLALADRVGVMRAGKLAGILPGPEATQERVLALAVG